MKNITLLALTLLNLIIRPTGYGIARNNPPDYYLSITVSMWEEHSHSESGIAVAGYCYDLESGKIEQVEATVEYSSQYPLSVYDKAANTLYYSERIEDESGWHGDQLFSYNLSTREKKQLTENIFAINYIIPVSDKVYIAAIKRGEREIHVMYYSLSEEKLVESNIDSGLFFELLSYDPVSGGLFGAAYRYSEYKEALEEANEGFGHKYIAPDYYIYDFSKDFLNPELILKTDRNLIQRLCYSKEYGLFFTQADSIPYWEPDYYSYFMDVNGKTLTSAVNIDSILYLNEFICLYKGVFYFVGVNEQDVRGIYKYSIADENIELVFASEDGYINGFVMLKK